MINTIDKITVRSYCKPLVMNHLGKKYIIGVNPCMIEYNDKLYNQVMDKWKKEKEEWSATRNKKDYVEHKVTSSKGDKEYTVILYDNKTYRCDCKAFEFHKKCKHGEKLGGKNV